MKGQVYINAKHIGEAKVSRVVVPNTTEQFLICDFSEPLIVKKVGWEQVTLKNIVGHITHHTITFIPRDNISLSDYIFLLKNSKLEGFELTIQTIYKLWKGK